MRLLSRVVWSEGMYLGPHHFQAQNRYFEDSIHFATSSLWFASYGLAGLELDAEGLQNGTVTVVHARGIFPDGLAFNMPESDPLPEPRPIAGLFPPAASGLTVMLAIPPRKPNGYNCSLEEGNGVSARFVAEPQTLHDENTGIDERSVRLGRKNLRLLMDSEPAGDLLTLPIARVKRDGAGHFIYDPLFVPPVVQISASGRLMLMVQRLLEILDEKSANITGAAAAGARGPGAALTAEFTTREIANFWLLHSVNSALPPLRHLLVAKRGHPEELYKEMLRLAGALCTFALDSHPRDLPLYDHDNLSDCFEKLERHIRLHLELVIPTNVVRIPLRQTENYYWEGAVTDTRCMGRARWVFAIRSGMSEPEMMHKVPILTKVCTPPFVRELVRRALPGMPLTHLPYPPSAISQRAETLYFGISRSGPCWDHMTKTREIGVYIPGEFPNAEPEILAILEQSE